MLQLRQHRTRVRRGLSYSNVSQSVPKNPRKRKVFQESQRLLIPRIPTFWRRQGVLVTRIYSYIRSRRSRDRIKEGFLDRSSHFDGLRLHNTLCYRLAFRVYSVYRGTNGSRQAGGLDLHLQIIQEGFHPAVASCIHVRQHMDACGATTQRSHITAMLSRRHIEQDWSPSLVRRDRLGLALWHVDRLSLCYFLYHLSIAVIVYLFTVAVYTGLIAAEMHIDSCAGTVPH